MFCVALSTTLFIRLALVSALLASFIQCMYMNLAELGKPMKFLWASGLSFSASRRSSGVSGGSRDV